MTTATAERTTRGTVAAGIVAPVRRLANPQILGPIVVFVAVVSLWQLGLFHAIFGIKTYTMPYPDGIAGGVEEHAPRLMNALAESVPAA